MSATDVGLGALVGGIVTTIGAMYAAHLKRDEKNIDVGAADRHEEREITERFALGAESRAARHEKRIETLSEETRTLAVRLATAEAERDSARATAEAERLGRVAAEEMARELTIAMSMAQQLLERLRDEVSREHAATEAARAETATVRAHFDAFVKRVMEGTDA